eukprot:TRINITY_DN891_c0_g1_i1.p1 TRINITY_DN891_c0_g1~~TRINITY_DN891_c0_g1_i1.p1  ORF type:complete len:409 (+),score=111.31 TRINITY_DN891_c0_g1_i1:644-1870(+)
MSVEDIKRTLKSQSGVLLAKPAIVARPTYSGSDLVAKNSTPSDVDSRGYWPVERWIVSKVVAQNAVTISNEGVSQFILKDSQGNPFVALFTKLLETDEELLLGKFSKSWPLTKILDIGGQPVTPNFAGATPEVPPIPAHVHRGIVNPEGKAVGPGKKEAYFFPPLNVPPYNVSDKQVITRLGLQGGCTREQFESALDRFGLDDSMYTLLNVYPIKPYDAWTILPGVVHAPGPYLTFEIQYPQDDSNLCCYRLGEALPDAAERAVVREELQLRGIRDARHFVTELIDWSLTQDDQFEGKYRHPAATLSEGSWGRQLQIFFDGFYGEGFEILPGGSWTRPADARPFGGIIWSGKGRINGNDVAAGAEWSSEFLVVPNTPFTVECTGDRPLLIYAAFPLEDYPPPHAAHSH